MENQECCPKFNPEPWDNKEFVWENKKFIQDKVCTIFYMPLNFGSVITRMNKKIDSVSAQVPDWLALSEHSSKWKMNLMVAVDKEIPNAQNVTLTGKFVSKVYEGNYKEMGNWYKDFESYCKINNYSVQKTFMWYTTCPKCAKKYGKNYTVFIAQLY